MNGIETNEIYQIYNSIVGAFSSIVKREGVFSLYKGLTASLFQIIPNMGLQFGFYESSKHLLRTMIDGVSVYQYYFFFLY